MRSRALCSRVWACTDEFVYENQYLSTVLAPQSFVLLLCTSVQCEPPRASYSVLVLAPRGFVLLCTSVRCEPKRPLCGASLQSLCASVYCTSSKSFVRCEPTKALYSVRPGLCFCVLYEPQALCTVRAYKGFVLLCTVRGAPRALSGASLQRLCASVCCTSPTSFVRCEPTKTLYNVRQGWCFCVLYKPLELCAVRAHKGFMQCADARPPGFVPSAYVLVRSYEQMSSCTRTCTYICTVRAHMLFLLLYGNLYACMSWNEAFTWN